MLKSIPTDEGRLLSRRVKQALKLKGENKRSLESNMSGSFGDFRKLGTQDQRRVWFQLKVTLKATFALNAFVFLV